MRRVYTPESSPIAPVAPITPILPITHFPPIYSYSYLSYLLLIL